MEREVLKMKNILLLISLCIPLLMPTLVMADHSPKKMMRNIKGYGQLGQTGKLGPFQVNVDKFGEIPKKSETSVMNKEYDKIFADKFNIATIILKGDEVVYERYATKRKINSNTLLSGMSMSKTAGSAAIGNLLCEGKIKSLDDAAGNYSPTLKAFNVGE